jgi:two-component system response regulator MprA
LKKPQILVIDDDPAVTDFLKRGLAYEGYSVREANDGKSGLNIARNHAPDLVILDVMMPGMDGLEVCRRLKAGSDVPVIMLTARDDVSDRVEGLDTGADDYLLKPFAFDELAARVRALLRRASGPDPEVIRYADLTLDTGSRLAFRGDREISLSATEYKLLLLLLSRRGQVVTRDQIMDDVWGYDFGGDSNVLQVYIRYLRGKLEQDGEPRLIQTMRGTGYSLRE